MKNSAITFRWVVDQNKVETSTIKIGKIGLLKTAELNKLVNTDNTLDDNYYCQCKVRNSEISLSNMGVGAMKKHICFTQRVNDVNITHKWIL